jgi:hypothetical protein
MSPPDDLVETAVDDNRAEVLKAVYGEICRRDESIWDIRLRLMAALPVVSGTAVGILITRKSTDELLLIPFGLFGALVTAGLFLYERRQIQICENLLGAGRKIEEALKITRGRFRGLSGDKRVKRARLRRFYSYKLVSVPTAGWFVYGASFGAWVFVFGLGLYHAFHD